MLLDVLLATALALVSTLGMTELTQEVIRLNGSSHFALLARVELMDLEGRLRWQQWQLSALPNAGDDVCGTLTDAHIAVWCAEFADFLRRSPLTADSTFSVRFCNFNDMERGLLLTVDASTQSGGANPGGDASGGDQSALSCAGAGQAGVEFSNNIDMASPVFGLQLVQALRL